MTNDLNLSKQEKINLILEKCNLEIDQLEKDIKELEVQFLNTDKNSREHCELLATLKININKYYYLISLRNAKKEIERIKQLHKQK